MKILLPFTQVLLKIAIFGDLTLFGSVSSRLSLSSLEQRLAAGLLRILLTRAGIESNPGPEEFYCCVCAKRLHPNSTSVRCNTCNGWSHLKTCSGLKTHREWTTSYVAPCCQRNNATSASTAVQPAPCSRTALPLQSSGQDRTSTVPRSSHRQHNSQSDQPPPPTFIQLQSSCENHPATPGSSHSLFRVSDHNTPECHISQVQFLYWLVSLSVVFWSAHHTRVECVVRCPML